MRNLVTAHCRMNEIVAVADDGTLWIGLIRRIPDASEPNDLIVEWKPLNGPPDGEPWFENKSMWDRIEEKIRANEQKPDRR